MNGMRGAWRTYKGAIWAVVGTAVVSYFTIASAVGWFSGSVKHEVMAHVGLAIGSVVVSSLINVGSFKSIRSARTLAREAESRYISLVQSSRPVLIVELERELRQRAGDLGGDALRNVLSFYVFSDVDGKWRVIASTRDPSSPVRRIALSPDEGVIGVTATHGAPVIVRVNRDGSGTVFNVHNDQLPDQKVLCATNRAKTDVGLAWISATPVFAHSASKPYDDRVIGVLSVDSVEEADGNRMRSKEFQEKIAQLAMVVSPLLSALHAIPERRAEDEALAEVPSA